MDQLYTSHPIEYCDSPQLHGNIPDLGSCSYTEYSTDPSPSPPMMFSSLDPLEYNLYANPESAPHYGQSQAALINSIEFMDLTVPQHENRRRRRSAIGQDKEAVSSMRIRRRAQNRASQRAFRERKEKHVQRLEQQLEDLETKHRELTKSYTDLDSTHDKLQREAKQLREELDLFKSSKEHSLMGIMEPTLFDPFTTDGLFDPRQDN